MQTIILYDMIYLGFWIPSIRWVPGLGSRVSLLGSWVLDSTFAVLRPVPRLPPLRWVPGCQALLKIRELHLIFQWRNFFRRFLGDLPKKKKKRKRWGNCAFNEKFLTVTSRQKFYILCGDISSYVVCPSSFFSLATPLKE